jgi:ABC-type Fe3+/spermidine/putrescine transport system ATPase subunit
MRAGRIEQVDTPEAIYDSPSTAFVASFIGAANLLAVTIASVGGDRIVVRLDAGAAEIALDLVSADGAQSTAGAEAGARPAAAGAAATLLLRPERVRLERAAPGSGEDGLPVTVRSIVFQGPVHRCVAVDDAGVEIAAHLPATSARPLFRPGERAWATWTRGAARLLPERAPAVAARASSPTCGPG